MGQAGGGEEEEDEDGSGAALRAHLLADFKSALSKKVVNMGELRRLACLGMPDGSAGVQPLLWKNFGRVMMALAVDVSRFEGVLMAPLDPILGVLEAFKADKNDLKLNLGVGAYRTEELQPYVLNVVKKAENLMLEKGENKEYLPIEGLAAFNKAAADLLFGADNPVIKERRVATLQSL